MRSILFITGSVRRGEAFCSAFQFFPEWCCTVADSYESAAKRFEGLPPVDIVLFDAKTPVENMSELLSYTKRSYPQIYRFVLRRSNFQTGYRCILEAAHASFSHPSSLRSVDFMLRQIDRFYPREAGVKTEPPIFSEFKPEAYRRDLSPEEILRVVETDSGLRSVVMKRVNSASYGLQNKVVNTKHAVQLLGVKNVVAIMDELNLSATLQ